MFTREELAVLGGRPRLRTLGAGNRGDRPWLVSSCATPITGTSSSDAPRAAGVTLAVLRVNVVDVGADV